MVNSCVEMRQHMQSPNSKLCNIDDHSTLRSIRKNEWCLQYKMYW